MLQIFKKSFGEYLASISREKMQPVDKTQFKQRLTAIALMFDVGSQVLAFVGNNTEDKANRQWALQWSRRVKVIGSSSIGIFTAVHKLLEVGLKAGTTVLAGPMGMIITSLLALGSLRFSDEADIADSIQTQLQEIRSLLNVLDQRVTKLYQFEALMNQKVS